MAVQTSSDRILDFDLATMADDARASWLAVYELGARDGWQRGYEAAEADMAALHRQAHAITQWAARSTPFDVLADRRGDHARADRQRQILRERGVA